MHAQAAGPTAPVRSLPSALEKLPLLLEALGPEPPRLFLDFDGTLSDIVDDPEDAALVSGLQPVLQRLAARIPLAFVSGRETSDVEGRVRIEGAAFAGSHGLDIRGPGFTHRVGAEASAALSELLPRLLALASEFPGLHVEEKALGLAVHYRGAADVNPVRLEETLSRLAGERPTLRLIR
ncbi:MAG: trehalose-phosphatase, partial [Gemmatimonadetes bacterium]|nr:trehalose-phosphatase [Gemmatimonadota bacterium]